MVYFQTKNPNLGKFWRASDWKVLINVFYGHLAHFMTIWYVLCSFGTFFLFLVLCAKKNLATLVSNESPVGGREGRFLAIKKSKILPNLKKNAFVGVFLRSPVDGKKESKERRQRRKKHPFPVFTRRRRHDGPRVTEPSQFDQRPVL
jgi:hypothetical protein